eukprot:242424-Chlamydomonas_euryale.AAC.2
MALHGATWPCMAPHSTKWRRLVLLDPGWSSMVLYDAAWRCMTLHGNTWGRMAVHAPMPWHATTQYVASSFDHYTEHTWRYLAHAQLHALTPVHTMLLLVSPN